MTASATAVGAPPGPARLTWVLRAGLAACFIGHGALGVLRTPLWAPYFAVAGIGRPAAFALMPWVGTLDIAMAFSVLIVPINVVVLYMAGWALWTALLRPLAGESFWEAVERAGNYGVPLALVLWAAGGGGLAWLRRVLRPASDAARLERVAWALRLTTALLLFGHGALQWFVHKPLFVHQYAWLGLPGAAVEPWLGAFECLLALAVLLRPAPALLLGVVAWKLATEALGPLTGAPVWTFIEHGGSYAAPLALALLEWRRGRTAPDEISLFPANPQTPGAS